MKKTFMSSKRNEESSQTISTKPTKKIHTYDNGDPILGKRKPQELTPRPKKKSTLSYLGSSNKGSNGPLFDPNTKVPEPQKTRSNSRGNLKGLLIFPNQPSNFQKIDKYTIIQTAKREFPQKAQPRHETLIFPVQKPAADPQPRVPFTARMPGENLNSLQFISSENIGTLADYEDRTPTKKIEGRRSSGKFNKSSYDIISNGSPKQIVTPSKPVLKKAQSKPQDIRQQFIDFIR